MIIILKLAPGMAGPTDTLAHAADVAVEGWMAASDWSTLMDMLHRRGFYDLAAHLQTTSEIVPNLYANGKYRVMVAGQNYLVLAVS